MIQRSKISLKFFPQRFRRHVYPQDQSIVTNTWSDAWHIAVALPAQQRCAQAISTMSLKEKEEKDSGNLQFKWWKSTTHMRTMCVYF